MPPRAGEQLDQPAAEDPDLGYPRACESSASVLSMNHTLLSGLAAAGPLRGRAEDAAACGLACPAQTATMTVAALRTAARFTMLTYPGLTSSAAARVRQQPHAR